jgi:hypothetical protein
VAAWALTIACCVQGQRSATPADEKFRALPAAWAGEWDGPDDATPSFGKGLEDTPAHEAVDPLIHSLLTPWGKAKMEATSYDDSPGSLCDPEGWFPFINYGYGFALLASPGKITMIPVEADTEGIRRVYLAAEHPKNLTPTWNGNSIAHWEGDTLVIDTVGFNALSWLGDDREPHTQDLHLVERMQLVHEGQYLRVEDEISDPKALTAGYTLVRYFSKWNASHLGAGPDRNMMELVCNEDPSPFAKEKKQTPVQ